MYRWLLSMLFVFTANAQQPCPVPSFETAIATADTPFPSTQILMVRQGDGSYTGFEMTSGTPSLLIRTIPAYGKQFAACVAKSDIRVPLKALNGPAAIGPASAVLKSGNYLFSQVSEGGGGLRPSVAVQVYDPQLNLISNRTYPMSAVVREVLFADVDGDGNLDMIANQMICIAHVTCGGFAVFPGNADGTFAATPSQSVPPLAQALAVADLNGDGRPDAIFLNGTSGGFGGFSLGIMYGQSDGTLGPQSILATFPLGSANLAVADWNGDGYPDLLLSTTGGVSVALNDGKGNFPSFTLLAAPSGFIAVGDVNGDGFPDIVTGATSILFGDGKGGVSSRADYQGTRDRIYLMDFDGDGIMDIVSASSKGPTSVLFGTGGGNFWAGLSTGNPNSKAIVADLDGDGIPDLVAWSTTEANLAVYRGRGDGRFDAIYSSKQFGLARVVAVGDFNGDGKPDIAISTGYSTTVLSVLINNGDGTFRPPVTSPIPGNPTSLAVGDLNGDGKLDVALVTSADANIPSVDSLVVLLGKGDGTFSAGTLYPVGPMPVEVVAADFHGNGHLDLVVANRNFGAMAPVLYTGKGDGTFSASQPLPVAGPGEGLLVADFDLDGKPDLGLVVAVPSAIGGNPIYTYTVLLGKGGGTFQTAGTYQSNLYGSLVADFNGDRIPDLVGSLGVFLGNGDGTFQTTPISLPTQGVVAVRDFNRDGKLDLIDTNLTVYLNSSRPAPAFALVASASNLYGPVAPGMLVTAYGRGLANGNASSVTVTDAQGTPRAAHLLYVSPSQINFEIPEGTAAAGVASVTITGQGGVAQKVSVPVQAVAPAFFVLTGLNANRTAIGVVDLVAADGRQSFQPTFTKSGNETVVSPIHLSGASAAYLSIYGSGLRGANGAATATVDGQGAAVTYVGPAPGFVGLDQVNIRIPVGLTGSRYIPVAVTVGGIASNVVYFFVN